MSDCDQVILTVGDVLEMRERDAAFLEELQVLRKRRGRVRHRIEAAEYLLQCSSEDSAASTPEQPIERIDAPATREGEALESAEYSKREPWHNPLDPARAIEVLPGPMGDRGTN